MSELEQKVLTFVEITGADPDLARVFLKHNDEELEQAVEEYMNNPGRYMVEEHAAEADESVRQPLAPIVSRLADDEYEPSARSRRGKRKRVEAEDNTRAPEGVFDALRDLKSEELFFRHLKTVQNSSQVAHQQHLANLYRPPHALITPGTFEEANQSARAQNKWLLVNVHEVTQFDCLRINRDVWSKAPIQQLVRDYFVLWYVYTNTATAKPYTSYYAIEDWPHVAVLDPYTGERLAQWQGGQYAASAALDEALNAFVAAHIGELSLRTLGEGHTPQNSSAVQTSAAKNSGAVQTSAAKNSSAGSEQRAVKRRRLADEEEERMMHQAILASLGTEGHSATEHVRDSAEVVRGSGDSTHASNTNTAPTTDTSADTRSDQASTVATAVEQTRRGHDTAATTATPSRGHDTAATTATPSRGHDTPAPSPVPHTVPPHDGPALQLQLRLPAARTEPRSYSADTPLHVLLADIRALLQLSPGATVRVSSNYPRRTFDAQLGEHSLRALGIENKSVLFVDVSEE